MMGKTALSLVILFILFNSIHTKRPRSRGQAVQKAKRACERGNCLLVPRDRNQNCINQCVSEACFLEIYLEDNGILEDGEINNDKYFYPWIYSDFFQNCEI